MKLNHLKYLLTLTFLLAFSLLKAQHYPGLNISDLTNARKSDLTDLDRSMVKVSQRHLSQRDIFKARNILNNQITKYFEEWKSDSLEGSNLDLLMQFNTNVTLWFTQVTTDKFQVFLRRLVTGRPISKDVIENIKKLHYKWIKKPTLKNLERYSKQLIAIGRSYEILTIIDVPAKIYENSTVRYKAISGLTEEVNTLSKLSRKIPVGHYYIWLEKDGKILTDNTLGYSCLTSRTSIYF